MKKIVGVVLAGVAVAIFSTLALAEYQQDEGPLVKKNMQDQMEVKRDMMKLDKIGPGPGGMRMGKELVATTDGGVVVLIGNKLMKYDANLNLVKETEIKIDKEAMQKMQMEKRPMMMEEKRP